MNYFWFRRDLRLNDNAGLYHALKSGDEVQCLFIFDKHILDKLSSPKDPRVHFIHQEIIRLQKELEQFNSSIQVEYGFPEQVWAATLAKKPGHIYTNEDYESYAIDRDQQISDLCTKHNVQFKSYKDHVIFSKDEVLKADGTPYTVFTPYKRKWLAALEDEELSGSYFFKSYPTLKYASHFIKNNSHTIPRLADLGFEPAEVDLPSRETPQSLIRAYDKQRNFPAINGTSKLGIHFRFGTISIREKARKASLLNETYLSELIWRDFYSQILQHFPHVERSAFRKKYENIEWRNNESEFALWCEGKTGYPLVDAGMRELNNTGHMHNRVRMVVASFLTKHLLIDWRWGEQYFAEKLLDFDMASNNGGWQWASGSGTDAAPYFRIFNPTSQLTKFDKELKYVKKWIPEYGTSRYVEPMVDHKMARERCLSTYKAGLN